MADFPVCPSSERTMSVLTPFRRGFMKTGKFYCKVVSASLFADSTAHAIDFTTKIVPSNLFAGIPPELKSCTAQSLSRFATAPFTQGSPGRVPFSTRTPLDKQLNKFPIYLHTEIAQYMIHHPKGGPL